jgi:2-C-methyl-D-erythritol 2,4-cyclodiphosphate synthase
MYISAIGQDSHRFEAEGLKKPLVLGGIVVPECAGLEGNSDADVVLHAITNAISGLHGVPILGAMADELCLRDGVTDSRAYLAKALDLLKNHILLHVSLSIEAKIPRLTPHLPKIRESIARLLSLSIDHVAITATTGEGLTSFGRGEGIQVLAIVSARETGQRL